MAYYITNMRPNKEYVKINDNLKKVKNFVNEIIITPKHALTKWAKITNQTPAAKIGYIGQHLISIITGVPGTGTGARGNDLADGSEIKSCNKIDQVDKCNDCGSRVLRIESKCSVCGSKKIERKNDSKWLFGVRDEHELKQYLNMDRIVLLLMDYPKFEEGDYKDIRISVFEIYPKEDRMSVFGNLLSNHYYNIYTPKLKDNKKTNPMNLHPWSFQFYKCNPIKIFECIIKNIDTSPTIIIEEDTYIKPLQVRGNNLKPLPMPSTLLKKNEWEEMISKVNYKTDILPLICQDYLNHKNITTLTKLQFKNLSIKEKQKALPFLDMKLRDNISLRPIVSTQQKKHYQRG